MTLRQLASAIRNNVVAGMQGVDFTNFSLEQLTDEILVMTPGLIIEYSAKGLLDIDRITQRIDGIPIECQDLSSNCQVTTLTCAPHFEIPTLNLSALDPLPYVGTPDGNVLFKVYFDRDFRYHKYRLNTAKAPFAWVSTSSNTNGLFDVYLFNMGKYENLRFVSIEGLFDNPYDLLETDFYNQFSTAEYYAPAILQGAIIDNLTGKYMKYYRQFEKKGTPNTQE